MVPAQFSKPPTGRDGGGEPQLAVPGNGGWTRVFSWLVCWVVR